MTVQGLRMVLETVRRTKGQSPVPVQEKWAREKLGEGGGIIKEKGMAWPGAGGGA